MRGYINNNNPTFVAQEPKDKRLETCMSWNVAAASEFLDVTQAALEQVRSAVGCCRGADLDGVLIRVDMIFQCLMWAEPVFLSSSNFSDLLSAVSDMINLI